VHPFFNLLDNTVCDHIVLLIFSAYIVAVLFFVVVLGDRSRFLGIAFKHFAFISQIVLYDIIYVSSYEFIFILLTTRSVEHENLNNKGGLKLKWK
jgi:hypothetical protein